VSLKHNLAANYLGQAWVAIVGLAFLPLYVKYLGNEALGLIGVFALMQMWLTLLDLGITPTLNREMARFSAGGHSAQSIADLLRSLEVVGAALAAIIAVALWAASGFVARNWLHSEQLSVVVVDQALAVMGLVIALRFVEGIYRGALFGLQRQVFYNTVNAALATARHVGAAAVVAFVSPTIRAFYLWQGAVSIVAVIMLRVAVHHSLPASPTTPKVSRAALEGVRRFAGGMLAITCLSLLVSQIDKVLLSRLLPLGEFGYYTLAATLSGALTLAAAPILQTIYPRLVELVTSGDQSSLAANYHQGAQLVAVTTVPAMLVLTVFPWGVVYAWSGQDRLATETAPLLLPLALGTFLNALMWMPGQSQLAYGWTGLTIKTNLVAVAAIVPAILLLVPRYGAQAAGWIWVSLNAGYVLVAVQFMHKRILTGELRRWYVEDVAAPLGGATLVALLIAPFAPGAGAGRLLWAAYLAGLATATAVTALMLAGTLRPRALLLARRLAYLGT
jgi:O-antigen/teichoic acid export membrane protein